MSTQDLIREKLAQAVTILQEQDVDCWLTFVRETSLNKDPTLAYLVPGDLTWHSALILTSTGRRVAIVGKYDRQTLEDLNAYDRVIGYVESIRPGLLETLRELNPRQIAVNYSTGSEVCDGLTHGMYLTLVDIVSGAGMQDRLVSAEGVISALRQRKTPVEVDALREAVRQALEIFRRTGEAIRIGQTEAEIAEFMRREVSERNLEVAWDPSSCPSVFTGPDTAGAHYAPTSRRVEPGHVLNIDFGVRVNGYCSDLQRTFYVPVPGEARIPVEVQRGFDVIRSSIEAARRAMKPGVTGFEIDRTARHVITSAGYEEFPHALGHQVGRFAHDGTALLGPAWEKYANKPFEKLERGMVFTIEPRLTVPGHGVVTIEEMVEVTSDGAEYLSTPQEELLIVKNP